MNGYGYSEEHQPVTWWRGHPVYAAHLLVAVFTVSMLVTTILQAAHVYTLAAWLPFDSSLVLQGQVWRIFTYGLVNPPSLPFVIDMVMIAWFGREVERAFGRRKFFALYGGIYLLPPLLLTLLGFWVHSGRAGEFGALALFVAFATLYPGALMMFNVLAKWAALILIAIFSLIFIAANDWRELFWLWTTTGFAYAFVRHEQGHFSLPRLRWPRRAPKLRTVPDLPAKKSGAAPRSAPAAETSMAEVDALLDKIAKSGIGSLTAAERAKLDAARADLLRREARR